MFYRFSVLPISEFHLRLSLFRLLLFAVFPNNIIINISYSLSLLLYIGMNQAEVVHVQARVRELSLRNFFFQERLIERRHICAR